MLDRGPGHQVRRERTDSVLCLVRVPSSARNVPQVEVLVATIAWLIGTGLYDEIRAHTELKRALANGSDLSLLEAKWHRQSVRTIRFGGYLGVVFAVAMMVLPPDASFGYGLARLVGAILLPLALAGIVLAEGLAVKRKVASMIKHVPLDT